MRYADAVRIGCAAVLFFANGASIVQAQAGRYRAGAAKVDITPSPSQLLVSTDSIRDRLFVRAIVVDNGSVCAVLVSVDGNASDGAVKKAISESSLSTKCAAVNYIVAGTHSHSASTGGSPGTRGFPNDETVTDAIVKAADLAKTKLAPARVGYGTATLDLNVNRDLFNSKQEWRQAPNPDGISDKTLSVVEFVGADDVPIGVYINYAMHPIMFYLSGVISADFPGEAARYVEELFDGKSVAVFTQGASGDQNPKLWMSPSNIVPMRAFYSEGNTPPAQKVGPPPVRPQSSDRAREAIPPQNLDAYRKAIARTGDYVSMLGQMIGSTALGLMRDDIVPVDTGVIWGGQQRFTCPGRQRLDAANPARENVFPGYTEGPDVEIKVGLLRLGDINFVSVNGEVYSKIGLRLKQTAPANKTIISTLSNGSANSGYIYSDDAYSHLTFQVIGSRLNPGCAEGKIIENAIELMRKSGQ